jgi:hypothetical protein
VGQFLHVPAHPLTLLALPSPLPPAPASSALAHWQGGPTRQPHIPLAHALLSADVLWALVVGLTPPAYVRVPDRRLGGPHW